MKNIVDLRDLMLEQLRDLYHAESHALKELYGITERVTDIGLQKVVKSYLELHEDQIMRLRQVFEKQFEQKRGEECWAMEAMVSNVHVLALRCEDAEVRDAALITSLQHIIHYKIAGYGAVTTYARELNLRDEARILHESLENEKKFDQELATLADSRINVKAIDA